MKDNGIDISKTTLLSEPSFLITKPTNGTRAQLEDGRTLFFQFLTAFLNVEKIQGLQNGHGAIKDQILFSGPHGSTLAVPIEILLEPREIALAIVKEKIRRSIEAFGPVVP